jgi:hypothetical protein
MLLDVTGISNAGIQDVRFINNKVGLNAQCKLLTRVNIKSLSVIRNKFARRAFNGRLSVNALTVNVKQECCSKAVKRRKLAYRSLLYIKTKVILNKGRKERKVVLR